MPLFLYKITLQSPQFLTIQHTITNISQHQPIQLLLIPFPFNPFLQPPPPFPLPIPISPLLLTQLPFNPLKPPILSLLPNPPSPPFPPIPIPVPLLQTFKLPPDVSL
ncbi:L-lactate permease, partial [Staphylococcus aureus]|uniref:L-lactate permease n=1 Tax=Staphylococcus aureus TaxID=1280 RepID=UPI0037D9E777